MTIHMIRPSVRIRAEIDCRGALLPDLETSRPFEPVFATVTVTGHPAGVWIETEVGDGERPAFTRYMHYHEKEPDPTPRWLTAAIAEAGIDIPAYAAQIQAWQPPATTERNPQ